MNDLVRHALVVAVIGALASVTIRLFITNAPTVAGPLFKTASLGELQ
jgi:hypothetical protein